MFCSGFKSPVNQGLLQFCKLLFLVAMFFFFARNNNKKMKLAYEHKLSQANKVARQCGFQRITSFSEVLTCKQSRGFAEFLVTAM